MTLIRNFPDDYAGQVARSQDPGCDCESEGDGCALCNPQLARERRAEDEGDRRRDEDEL